MSEIIMIGFHACKSKGDPEFPFLSKDHNKTWLTQGYYFWTDSDYWAKFWGERSVSRNGCFTVLECEIALASYELLDLVGNALHLELFAQLIEFVRNKTSLESVTVRTVLKYLRSEEDKEPGSFPFLAIKAADHPKSEYKFVEQMSERLATLNRQQLCIFEQASDRINLIRKCVYER